MFVTCSITKCKTAAFIKEAVPFYILLVVNLMLLTWFEPFTTFLVNLSTNKKALLPNGGGVTCRMDGHAFIRQIF